MRPLTSAEFLRDLQRRGASRLTRVSFRRNRSTVWSLTQEGTVLNVHDAYRLSSPELLDAFAVIATEGGVATAQAEAAGRRLYDWSELRSAIDEARSEHESRRGSATSCSATPDQRRYLSVLYDYFNKTRFGDSLPAEVPIRLSTRMTSSLGHMLPGEGRPEERYVAEIALNADLMLEGNGAERVDTLLHEMAHVADYLSSGHRDHGRTWREWALRIGCVPETLYDRPVRRRQRLGEPVTRVPPLPHALWPG